jgi:hypothetical protein
MRKSRCSITDASPIICPRFWHNEPRSRPTSPAWWWSPTSHWYWLVDGLLAADDRGPLANPAARQQYSGLQYPADHAEARGLAHVLRLGVLPAGSIAPKAERAGRAVWRQRAPGVRPQTANVLSLPNSIVRQTGGRRSAKRRHALPLAERERLLPEPAQVLAVPSSLAGGPCLGQQITPLAKAVRQPLQHTPAYEPLLTVEGMGTLWAQTIGLATGALRRCAPVGHDPSYCRCGQRTTISHGKRTGQGNVNNGHPYLEWASREAAPLAIRCSPTVPRLYPRQQAKSPWMVARKAVAHPLARASSDVMRDLVPFAGHKACG